MPSRAAPPVLALRSMAGLRRLLIGAQLVALLAAAQGEHGRGALALLAPALMVLLDLALVVGARRGWRPGAAGLGALAAVDLALFSAALWTSGGAESPLSLLLLVQVAVDAALLPVPAAAALGALAALAYAAGLWPGALSGALSEVLHGHAHGPAEAHGQAGHLWGHLASFVVVDAILVGLIGRLATGLRAAEAEAAEAQRLAAVGTLAAGVAHALGTPLGSVRLLAEELEAELPPAARPHPAAAGIVRQLARARGILDALLAGEEAAPSAGASAPFALAGCVEAWVDEWRAAQGAELRLILELPALEGCAAPGPAGGWRAALWCALDNARRAGGPITVRAQREAGALRLEVRDSGGALDPAVAARAGEPFFSAWPGGGGAGLGLHSAGRFARARGGGLRLLPTPTGACLELRVPLQ